MVKQMFPARLFFIKEKSPVALSHLSFSKDSHVWQRGVEGAFTLMKRAEWKVGRLPCTGRGSELGAEDAPTQTGSRQTC